MKKTAPFILLVVLFAAVAWYLFVKESDPVHETPAAHVPPALPIAAEQDAQEPDNVMVEREPKPVVVPDPLPPLEESDAKITGALAEIVGADSMDVYLVRDQVISRTVAMIDSLTSRQVPGQVNPVKPVDDAFIAETQGDQFIMSEENFARYDPYVALIQGLDTKTFMKVYRRHYPLFQEAWHQNGGKGSFRKRLIEVIDNLLETPDVPGPVYLVKPEAVYLFAEPELEAMTAGQKILIRMGSANASVVKEKLAEIMAVINPKKG